MASEQEALSLMADLEQETEEEVQTTVAPRRPIRRLAVGAVVVACLMGVLAAVGLRQPSKMPETLPLDMRTLINKEGGMSEALEKLPGGGKMKPVCKKALESMEEEYSEEELGCAPDKNGEVRKECESIGVKLDCHANNMKRCTQETTATATMFGETHTNKPDPIHMCLPNTCNEGNMEEDIKALAKLHMPPLPPGIKMSVTVDVTCD